MSPVGSLVSRPNTAFRRKPECGVREQQLMPWEGGYAQSDLGGSRLQRGKNGRRRMFSYGRALTYHGEKLGRDEASGICSCRAPRIGKHRHLPVGVRLSGGSRGHFAFCIEGTFCILPASLMNDHPPPPALGLTQ